MSMQSEGKNSGKNSGKTPKGRNYDQVTRDGSSAAGTLGTGGTGDVDRQWSASQPGNEQRGNSQQAGRTDDLLSTDVETGEQQGFRPSEEAGELQTGLNGIESLSTGKAGNRQSEE